MGLKYEFVKNIGGHPTNVIKVIFWIAFVGLGAYIVSPMFHIDASPGLRDGLGHIIAIKVYGATMFLTGLGGLISLRKNTKRYKFASRAFVLVSFLLLLFFSGLRIFAFGIDSLPWVSYFINALVMGVVYLKLQWEKYV